LKNSHEDAGLLRCDAVS